MRVCFCAHLCVIFCRKGSQRHLAVAAASEWHVWNENISCHIGEQEMSQWLLASKGEWGLPKTEHNAHDPAEAASPPKVTAEEMWKYKKQPSATP